MAERPRGGGDGGELLGSDEAPERSPPGHLREDEAGPVEEGHTHALRFPHHDLCHRRDARRRAYSAIGAAERAAIVRDEHARQAGGGPAELSEFAGSTLDGAGCRTDLEALALIEWRVTRTTQALQKLERTGPDGRTPEPLMHSILLTSGARAGLLTAAMTMRNPHRAAGDTREAARGLRLAVQALEQATADAHRHQLTAELLELTD